MIREIVVDDPITYEYPPDGSKLAILDPYDGCAIGCPYCFQRDDPAWNREILVKTNLPELVRTTLADWPREQVIYIGSRGDPYQPLEEKYGLTRGCLEALDRLAIPTMVDTKAGSEMIWRDAELMGAFHAPFTLVLGLAHLGQLEAARTPAELPNVQMANRLWERGMRVWTFITPVLPGITDVRGMIGALREDIPVYLDIVRMGEGSQPAKQMLAYIARHHPELLAQYEAIARTGVDPYCEGLRREYAGNERVRFVFG